MVSEILVGNIVLLHGLKKASSLNGVLGKVIKFHENGKRWEIKVERKKILAVKRENLKVISRIKASEMEELITEIGSIKKHRKSLDNITSDLTNCNHNKDIFGKVLNSVVHALKF